MTPTEQRIQQCIDGDNHWVCFECARTHSKNPPYGHLLTMHMATCDICECHKPVGPSYKLFGSYRSDIHKEQ